MKKANTILTEPLYVTIKHFLKNPITTLYPFEKLNEEWTKEHLAVKEMWINYRGCHALDDETCIGCSLCARTCPEGAIKMVLRVKEGKEKKRPQINIGRCTFCGFCVEDCPTNALTFTDHYELSDYTKNDFIYTPERLVEIGKKYKRKIFPVKKERYAEVDWEKCIGCGLCAKKYFDINANLRRSYDYLQFCIKECPKDAIEMVIVEDEKGRKVRKAKRDIEKCVGCYNCIETCRSGAITIKYKEEKNEHRK